MAVPAYPRHRRRMLDAALEDTPVVALLRPAAERENNTAILERVFLIRRLPAWHRNESKRVVRTPKIHLLDSGLATAPDWRVRRQELNAAPLAHEHWTY